MNETLQALLNALQASARDAADTVADAAYGVGKKAEQLLSVSKQNIRIADLRAQVNEQLQQVGQMIYATHTGDPTDSDALLEKLRTIDALQAQIDTLQAWIRAEEARIPVCPVCGAASRSGDVFCRSCGARL